MSARLSLVLAALLLPGCDIDFVAVDAVGPAYVVLRSEHGDLAEATVDVVLPADGARPVVLLGGIELPGAEDDGHWRYRAMAAVDTLDPILELEIQSPASLVVPLAFVTRNGVAVWQENGDLELPVRYGGDPDDPWVAWQVFLVDSIGNRMVRIESRAAALPTPIVLDGALVPAGAVAAEVTAFRQTERGEAGYPVAVAVHATTRVPIQDGT